MLWQLDLSIHKLLIDHDYSLEWFYFLGTGHFKIILSILTQLTKFLLDFLKSFKTILSPLPVGGFFISY